MKLLESLFSTKKMHKVKKCFQNYPCARYAMYVRFKKANRLLGVHNEVKKFYCSIKHVLYWFKLEVSVLSIGVLLFAPGHVSGSKSDIEMFRSGLYSHTEALSKFDNEKTCLVTA